MAPNLLRIDYADALRSVIHRSAPLSTVQSWFY